MARTDAQRGHRFKERSIDGSGARWGCGGMRGFTLVELLVSMAIIAVLVSLLLPAIGSVLELARSRQCQAGQRAVAFDFSIFSNESLHGFRGSDSSSTMFSLASFQDAQFQVGEFWNWGSDDEIEMPDSEGHDPMRCPEVTGPITLVRGRHAYEGGVGPVERLSYGFNIRLHLTEVTDSSGRPRARPISLSSAIGDQGMVPLMWDIDGAVAAERGLTPLLSGPSLGNTGVFGGDRYWFPAFRHHGKGNFLFIDGHSEESAAPLDGPGWNWGYSPSAR